MAKLVDNGTRTEYESYAEYVQIQDSRAHDYDCPNCFKKNMELLNRLDALGVKYSSVLDIGCRDASWFDELGGRGIACKGIDISPRSVGYAKSKGRDVVLGDAAELFLHFPKESFDLMMSVHSFEHFLKPDKVLDQCSLVLKPGGHIAITLPAQEKLTGPNATAHVRCYDSGNIAAMLGDAGFLFWTSVHEGSEISIIGRK